MAAMRIDEEREERRMFSTATEERVGYRSSENHVRRARNHRKMGLVGTQGTFGFETKQFVSISGEGDGSSLWEPVTAAEYRLFLENMEGALILSAEGTILYCNGGLSRLLESPVDSLVGLSFSRFIAPESARVFGQGWMEADKRRVEVEVGLISLTGKKIDVRLSLRADFVDDRLVFCIAVADASNGPHAEHALSQAKKDLERAVETRKEWEAKYLDLYENANIIIFNLDLEGRFTSANRTTYRELALSEQEGLAGKSFVDFLTPDSSRFMCLFGERSGSLGPAAVEEPFWEFEAVTRSVPAVHLDVHAHSIQENGSTVGIQCIAQNITERKRVEMELTRLAAAIEQAVESVIMLDKAGKIQYANSAFFRTSGYSREEVLGKSPAFLKSGKRDGETFYRGLLNTLTTKSVWTGRISNRKRDGSTYEAETTISPVRDKSGKIVNYVAVERDVTEEVRLEGQLRQMQKMEAIGTLAGGIAHDFNNILSAIIGFSEMSIEDIEEGHPAKNYASHILKAAIRGRDLVRQILMFSHKNEEDRKHFRLGLIIKEAMKLLRASLPSTIDIRARIESENGVILASPTQIHQVLMNLCTNAGHAMREKGGVLEVALSEFEMDSTSEAPYLGMEPGSYLKMSVSDTGIGMDRAVLDRIFDPFFTTKSPTEGTGMGLAVVHGIVKGHGGGITVKSIPGKGSVFDVYFPRTDLSDAEEGEGPSSFPKGTESILLVDDEEAIIEMAQSMLRRLGYQVTVVNDSLEAREIFRKEPGAFDLVITDHTMPRMTGTELAKDLMEIQPKIPVILCTGYSEMINREMAKDLGIREFIMKPVARSELAHAIRRVLDDEAGIEG